MLTKVAHLLQFQVRLPLLCPQLQRMGLLLVLEFSIFSGSIYISNRARKREPAGPNSERGGARRMQLMQRRLLMKRRRLPGKAEKTS
jgi:hypothetical protein